MKSRIFTIFFIGGALVSGSSNIKAQTFGLEYTSEWQTDFKGGYDWLNLLKTNFGLDIYGGLSVQASTISVAKTGEDPLIDDLLTYSNIEAGNIPLTFARLGVGLSLKESEFFVGVNNVNEDYFTSDLTSFFTNSSFGISPTISCNYDIANYPLAALCAHYRQRLGNLSFQTSLYPGVGYHRLSGHDNLFSVNFKRDGLFSISSIDFNKNGFYCVLGAALHYGMCLYGSENGQKEASSPSSQKRFSATPWLLSEFSLPSGLGFVAHASFSTVSEGCKYYAGASVLYELKRMTLGLAVNYASFTGASERSAELSCRFPILADKVHLQPSLHFVSSDEGIDCVGLFRLEVNL